MTSAKDTGSGYRVPLDAVELTSEHEGDSGVESTSSADSVLYIRIAIPDLNIQVRICYIAIIIDSFSVYINGYLQTAMQYALILKVGRQDGCQACKICSKPFKRRSVADSRGRGSRPPLT